LLTWPSLSPTLCAIRSSAASLRPTIENQQRRAAPGGDMPVLIDVEDDGWRRVQALDALAERAVVAAIAHDKQEASNLEVSLLFTGDDEATRLNREWRNRTYAPNVLSFPAAPSAESLEGQPKPLGDLILAAGVVAREATEQGKTLDAHIAHLIVHGMLHLLGYDHMSQSDASAMEPAE